MSKALAIARRIFSQFAHDSRTLALMFLAPVIVLWLLSVLLTADTLGPKIATVDLPSDLQAELERQDARISDVSQQEANRLLENNEVSATLSMDGEVLVVRVEGTDSGKTQSTIGVVSEALSTMQQAAAEKIESDVESKKNEIQQQVDEMAMQIEEVKGALPTGLSSLTEELSTPEISIEDFTFATEDYLPVQDVKVEYLHGNEDWKMFDFFGPVFIIIFLFVFTFITSGMSLVNERAAGTMARFLATPVKPAEILGGYMIGFGTLALVQTAVILAVALGLIRFPNEGNLALVIFVSVSTALASVTLGLLVSGLASSAFQVIQLVLLFVVPQILLCGLFDLSAAPEWLQFLGNCFPVTYAVDALRAIMLRGAGLSQVGMDIAVIWAFIIAFFILAAFGFRKKRATATC